METETLTYRPWSNEQVSVVESISHRLYLLRKQAIQNSFQVFDRQAHRMEEVARVRGVAYIDDSKSSNIHSTWYALEELKKQAVWIVGGKNTEAELEEVKALAVQKVRAIICLGQDAANVRKVFSSQIPLIREACEMETVVQMAYGLAKEGEVVLFSPGCSSFDMFDNYEDRGNRFKKAVREL